MDNPLFHKFTVFSEFDSEGEIIPKIAKCNNCGVIHKVIDFCRSEIITNLKVGESYDDGKDGENSADHFKVSLENLINNYFGNEFD